MVRKTDTKAASNPNPLADMFMKRHRNGEYSICFVLASKKPMSIGPKNSSKIEPNTGTEKGITKNIKAKNWVFARE